MYINRDLENFEGFPKSYPHYNLRHYNVQIIWDLFQKMILNSSSLIPKRASIDYVDNEFKKF